MSSLGPTHSPSAARGCHAAVRAGDAAVASAVLPPPLASLPPGPFSALRWVEIAVPKTSSKSSAEEIALCKSRVKVLGFVRAQRKVLDWIFQASFCGAGREGLTASLNLPHCLLGGDAGCALSLMGCKGSVSHAPLFNSLLDFVCSNKFLLLQILQSKAGGYGVPRLVPGQAWREPCSCCLAAGEEPPRRAAARACPQSWGHAVCAWGLWQERLSLGSSCPCQHERGRSARGWHPSPGVSPLSPHGAERVCLQYRQKAKLIQHEGLPG